MGRMKVLLVVLVGLLPASGRKNALLNRLGHEVHPTAEIKPILLLRVRKLRVGPGTTIKTGNRLRGLRLAEFGQETYIGPRNDFRAGSGKGTVADDPELQGVLKVGNVVFVSKLHEIDCTGGVVLEDWSGLAGRGTMIYSHSYDPQQNASTCGPTRIGRNSMVATKAMLAKGATLPEGSILAMGGVLLPGATKTFTMYGGVPAKALAVDISDWKFLKRTSMTPRVNKGAGVAPTAVPATD